MQKMNVESTTTVSLGGTVAVITDTSKTWNYADFIPLVVLKNRRQRLFQEGCHLPL